MRLQWSGAAVVISENGEWGVAEHIIPHLNFVYN